MYVIKQMYAWDIPHLVIPGLNYTSKAAVIQPFAASVNHFGECDLSVQSQYET